MLKGRSRGGRRTCSLPMVSGSCVMRLPARHSLWGSGMGRRECSGSAQAAANALLAA